MISVFLSLAGNVLSLDFKGGNAAELAKALLPTGNAVVIQMDDRERFPRTIFEYQTMAGLRRQVANRFGFVNEQGGVLGFQPQVAPTASLFPGMTAADPLSSFLVTSPTISHNGEFITVHCPAGVLTSVETLAPSLSHPIKCHWLYKLPKLFVECTDATESQLISAIASAVGGKLVVNGTYNIQLNPERHRLVAASTLRSQAEKATEPFEQARFLLMAGALERMTDAQIEALYKDEGNIFDMDVYDDLALRAALKVEVEAFTASTTVKTDTGVAWAADYSKPFRISIHANGTCTIRVPTAGSNTYVEM